MAFGLNSAQHQQLDQFLDHMLEAYATGKCPKDEVVGALAHVFTAAMIDNEGEVEAWIGDPDVLERWKSDVLGRTDRK